jgi:hypothetical protein
MVQAMDVDGLLLVAAVYRKSDEVYHRAGKITADQEHVKGDLRSR